MCRLHFVSVFLCSFSNLHYLCTPNETKQQLWTTITRKLLIIKRGDGAKGANPLAIGVFFITGESNKHQKDWHHEDILEHREGAAHDR